MLEQGQLPSLLSKMTWLVETMQTRRGARKFYERLRGFTPLLILKNRGFEFYKDAISRLFTPKHVLVYLPCLPKTGLYPSQENFGYSIEDICQQSDELNANQKAGTCSSGSQVLVVDDNQMNQKIAALLLEKAGYNFTIVSNGLEALNLVKSGQKFGVILMDCHMPIMDGLTSTGLIRQWELQNGLDKTPIIALTGSVEPEEIRSCYDIGMDAYLSKPYRSEQLINLLSELNLTV